MNRIGQKDRAMLANSLVEVEIAARLLEAGHRREAYGVAVAVLHKVGDSLSADARACWDRAQGVALAAQDLPRAA